MSTLRHHYDKSDHRHLFQPFSDIVYAGTGTTKIHSAAQRVVAGCAALQADAPPRIAHLLSMYVDMFIPLLLHIEATGDTDEDLCTDAGEGAPIETHDPTTCFHPGLLQNHVNKLMQCSFWSDTGKQEPIVHLLSKSTPQRCQIRSLSHIVYNYSRLHDDVFDFLLNCLRCSLMGSYSNAQRPPLVKRMRIHHLLQTTSKHSLLQWMKHGHQQLLFFVMKEYMVCLLYTSPSPRDRQKSRMPSSA